jgi:hypothetical protein
MVDWLNVSHISFQELRKIAYECGFMKRQSKKIDAASFLADLWASLKTNVNINI